MHTPGPWTVILSDEVKVSLTQLSLRLIDLHTSHVHPLFGVFLNEKEPYSMSMRHFQFF